MKPKLEAKNRDPLLLIPKLIERIDSYLEDLNLDPCDRMLGVFSASELGSSGGSSLCKKYTMGCGRLLYYRYTKEPPELREKPKTKRIFDLGKEVHNLVQTYLENISEKSKFLSFEREVPIDWDTSKLAEEYEIASTMDGILTVSVMAHKINIPFIVEIKSMSTHQFKTLTSALDYNILQLNVYMALSGIHRGILLYVDKNTGDLKEYPQAFDQDMWDATVAKIEYVRTCAKTGDIPPKETNFFCSDCKYFHICKPKVFSSARPKIPECLRKPHGR
jgi:CRISPR/Cas system-associated exonuclease Cas4 (RecB family)